MKNLYSLEALAKLMDENEGEHAGTRANTQVRPWNTWGFVGAYLRVCPMPL